MSQDSGRKMLAKYKARPRVKNEKKSCSQIRSTCEDLEHEYQLDEMYSLVQILNQTDNEKSKNCI